jgi:ubiquinone/menaquinone biosynthesis C-methylase UbiE
MTQKEWRSQDLAIEKGLRNVGLSRDMERWAATYDAERNPLIASEENITLNLIGNVRNQRVLDVGCGTGRYSVLLAKRGAYVVGIDPSAKMLERARRKITSSCKFELCLGRIENADFPDSHFNVVVCALTVGHLLELEPAIRQISRIVKSRGRLIVSDMHPFWFVSGFDYVKFIDRSGQEYRIRVRASS